MSLNVLYLTMNPNRASTTTPTEGWIRCLRPKGLVPIVATNQRGAFFDWCVSQGLHTHFVDLPVPDKRRPWRFLQSLWKLRELVKRHQIDVIHCNEQDIYPNGQYLARWTRKPVLVSIHFTMTREYCEWAFRGKRQPDRIFFISPGNLEACRPAVSGIIDSSRWRMLYNGLDGNHFRIDEQLRAQFRQEHCIGDGLAIGVACALRERKQVEHLFDAAARLPQNIKVVLAGGGVPGEEAYAAALLERGKRQLGERLVHVGHLTELRGFYNSLDLFVNTSREEACSISVLEAMACGCPVVGYPSKSVDSQVLPGGGEMVEQDNIDQLASVLKYWLENPERRQAGRLGARRRIESEFEIRRVSDQLWMEYLEVANERRKEPIVALPTSVTADSFSQVNS